MKSPLLVRACAKGRYSNLTSGKMWWGQPFPSAAGVSPHFLSSEHGKHYGVEISRAPFFLLYSFSEAPLSICEMEGFGEGGGKVGGEAKYSREWVLKLIDLVTTQTHI